MNKTREQLIIENKKRVYDRVSRFSHKIMNDEESREKFDSEMSMLVAEVHRMALTEAQRDHLKSILEWYYA